jgi:AcrR family transcriptional regulator
MSPRPRSVSDASILEATARMISRVGPVRLTLADVGEEVGLAPATLLQRFGSKRGLLLALVEQSVDAVGIRLAEARAQHTSALDAVLAAATEMAAHVRSPEELANSLAFLQIDLSDPDFHRLTLEHHEDGSVTIEGEAVDNPDDYKADPVPGAPGTEDEAR